MPEGLDLDAWINPPPEDSESEEEEEIANLGQVNINIVCMCALLHRGPTCPCTLVTAYFINHLIYSLHRHDL